MMNMDVRLPEDYQEQVYIGSLLFGVDDLLSLHQRSSCIGNNILGSNEK